MPGAPLLMTVWRHTRPQALVNGYYYWRCIAAVWLWGYPVQLASRFLGGICFHPNEGDVGSWRLFTSSIDDCNFAGAYLGYPPAATLLASFISINDSCSSHSTVFAHPFRDLSRNFYYSARWQLRTLFRSTTIYRELPFLAMRDTIPAVQTRIIDFVATG